MFKVSNEDLFEKFKKLQSREDLAELLEIKDKSLRYFLYCIKPDNMYIDFSIPKKSGAIRKINAPTRKLKSIQKKIAYILNLIYEPKACTCGFVINKSILDNAQKHIKTKLLLNIDLKDFFNQINFGRVRGALMSKPYSVGEEAATAIAQLVCYKGQLPQGAPTSPVISNIVCRSLDNSFMRLAVKYHLSYSRYADDITISTFSSKLPQNIINIDENGGIKIGNDIVEILTINKFEINEEKLALRNRFQHQEVTGLTVNKKVNINRKYIKNLRAILHNMSKTSIIDEARKYVKKNKYNSRFILSIIDSKDEEDIISIKNWFEKVITGKILFIRQIKGKYDRIYLKYAEEANRIFGKQIFILDYIEDFEKTINDSVMIIESTENQGTCFYSEALGLITCFHVTETNDFYKVYKRNDYPSHLTEYFEDNFRERLYFSEEIDYAIYKVNSNNYKSCFSIAENPDIKIGDIVTVIGYPNYIKGDSPHIEECRVTSKTKLLGAELYTVSGRIIHGSSGGVVLNNKNEIIGIIKAGVLQKDYEKDKGKHGFISIKNVLTDINNKQQLSIKKTTETSSAH